MGVLKIFFIVSLVSFISGELIRITIFGLETKLLDFTILILFLLWIGYSLFNKAKFTKILYPSTTPFILTGAFSLLLGLRFLSLNEVFLSSLYLLRWIGYAGIFSLITVFDKSFKNTIKTLLLISGFFLVIAGYVQLVFYENLRNLYYLGWDEHLYRMFSTFLDPNFAGAFFTLYFLFLLDLIFANFKNKSKQIIFFSMAVPTLFAIFLTYSRSAVFMLIFGVCLYLIFKKMTILIGILILFFVSLTFLLPKAYKTEGTNFLRTASSEARLTSYKEAFNIFRQNPLFGVGFNAYKYAKERYGYITSPPAISSHADASADNSFLFILATTGMVGLVTYLYLWYTILKFNKKNALILSSIAALFVNSFFINSLFYNFFILWMWILIGVREKR